MSRVVAADVEDTGKAAKKGSATLWAQLCNSPRALGQRAGCSPKYSQTWRVLLLVAAVMAVTVGQAYWELGQSLHSDLGLRQKDFRPHGRPAPAAFAGDGQELAPAPDAPKQKKR